MTWWLIFLGASFTTWLLVGPPGQAFDEYKKTLPRGWSFAIDVIALTVGSTLGVLISR